MCVKKNIGMLECWNAGRQKSGGLLSGHVWMLNTSRLSDVLRNPPSFHHSILLTIIFLTSNAFAQETYNSSEVETNSYQLYLEKKWNALIDYGNKALDKNIDYYYLRMRMGIAHYEKQEYRLAQKHFWKAISFNSAEVAAMEYLYYSYIFSGQFDEAEKLTKKFSADLLKKLKLAEQSPVNFLFAEGGTKQSSRSDLFSPPRYIQFGFGHQLGKSISVTHAFTNYFQPLQGQPPGIFNQNQYYIKGNISLGKSWLLSPSGHWMQRKFTPNKPPKNMPQPAKPPQTQTINSSIFSLSLRKSLSYFDVKISSSVYKEMIGKPILQESASITYFPLANNKFSISATGFLIRDNVAKQNLKASSFTISVRPAPRVSFSGNYLMNQSVNLNEENGYTVNNSYDLTSSRISGTIDFSLSKNVSVYLLLMKENKTETQKNINYYYNSAIIGLKIIP